MTNLKALVLQSRPQHPNNQIEDNRNRLRQEEQARLGPNTSFNPKNKFK